MQNPHDILFDEMPVWVQLHNLPMDFMHQMIIRKLGERLGRVLDIDAGNQGMCSGKYARVRLMKKIDSPLWRKRALLFFTKSFPSSVLLVGDWVI